MRARSVEGSGTGVNPRTRPVCVKPDRSGSGEAERNLDSTATAPDPVCLCADKPPCVPQHEHGSLTASVHSCPPMKTTTLSPLLIAALTALLLPPCRAADNAPSPSRPLAPPAERNAPAASARPTNPALTAEKTAGELEASKATEKANHEHVRAADPFTMEVPPPAPRPETPQPAPGAGYVWVPGHWTPVKGEWQWTQGEWGVPATPSSIWIPSKYDAKTKKWSAGYWQPDRVQAIEPPPPEKGPSPAPGAPPAAPAPY